MNSNDSSDCNLYYVVLTIKSPKTNHIDIHAVPAHWIDGNILYYPKETVGKSTIEGLVKAGRFGICDKKKWKKYAFILKKKFNSWDMANKYVNSKHGTDDTDDTDNENLKRLQEAQILLSKSHNKASKSSMPNYDFLMENNSESTKSHNKAQPNFESKTLVEDNEYSDLNSSHEFSNIESQSQSNKETLRNQTISTVSDGNINENEQFTYVANESFDVPVINIDDNFENLKKILIRVEQKVDDLPKLICSKIEECVKSEFAKTAVLLENIIRQNIKSASSSLQQTSLSSKTTSTATSSFGQSEKKDEDSGVPMINKIITLEDIQKFESSLDDINIVNQYTEYFQSILLEPTSSIPEVRSTTIILQVTNRLFEKQLLADKFTWSGRSPSGPKIAFKSYSNIIKLYYEVIKKHVPQAKFADVENLLNKKVLKHAKARAKSCNVRQSTGRKFIKPRVKNTNKENLVANEQTILSNCEKNYEEKPSRQEFPMDETENEFLSEDEGRKEIRNSSIIYGKPPRTADETTSGSDNSSSSSSDDNEQVYEKKIKRY